MSNEFLDRARMKLAHTLFLKPRRLRLSRGALSVTFDDFPRSSWTEGGAVLAQHGVRATYFASGGLCKSRYLGIDHFTPSDLESISASGHEIGSHAFDHIRALDQTSSEFIASVKRNETFLQAILPNTPVHSFAYPFGAISLRAKLEIAMRYRIGRGIRGRLNTNWIDSSGIKSVGFEERRQLDKHQISRLIEDATEKRAWLVVFTHDVSDKPTPWGCRQRDLEHLIGEAKQAGLDILPVRDVVEKAFRAHDA